MVLTRRQLFILPALSKLLPARSIRAGDWVRVVSMPRFADEHNRHPDVARVGRQCRLCLGKRCRVIDVDESGRPELDVLEHVRSTLPGLIGCSISFDVDCVRTEC